MKKILLVVGILLFPFVLLAFQGSGSYSEGDENFITPTTSVLGLGVLSSLALIIGIINFSMILRLRKRAKNAKSNDGDISKSYFPGNDELQLPTKWDTEYEKLGSIVSDLKGKLSDFENRLKAFEDDGRVVEFKVEKTDRVPAAHSHPGTEMLYAKLPDTNDGFSSAVLSSEQDGEKIYEITVQGESATFEISGDKDAQKYALSDYTYYLGNACIMENAPEKDSRIITGTPGKLSKNGKDWIIADKALIKFI
ncbi:MAG: hypothetical protein V4721_03265 [Bacteroidota bacterium]